MADHNKLYAKNRWFQFFCCEITTSSIQIAPAYGICISQSMRYSRTYGSHQDFRDGRLLLGWKLLNKWILVVINSTVLRSSSWFAYPLWNICFTDNHRHALTYNRILTRINKTEATSDTGTANPWFIHGIYGVLAAQSLVFCVIFCGSLFEFLSFYLWRMFCHSIYGFSLPSLASQTIVMLEIR